MGNQPIMKLRAGSMSIAVFENKGKGKDGKPYVMKSLNIQRSYKEKDSDEWINKDLSINLDDVPKLGMLLQEVYTKCMLREKEKETE